ncbi:amino acid transporter [Rickenella mellea]|uniref:Amino acid transporter n=1 Tax=Rickenella mellea TaxID=50990 RepID=A0A4Y7QCE0_9AGAM|nr:amino acid transporter [Rickenella mellea]
MSDSIDSELPDDSERQPFLSTVVDEIDGGKSNDRNDEDVTGESFDAVPIARRQIGVISAVFLIFNRIIGSGIYATPAVILKASGSVGMSLVVWTVGALVAAAGTAVYIELGTGLPRSGGEKNYLEYIYRRPRFFATCMYSMYALFLCFSSANCVVFAEYVLNAFSIPPTRLNTRFVAVLSLTFAGILHGTSVRWGLRAQNALGFFKLGVLLSIACAGALAIAGAPGFRVDPSHASHNFDKGEVWKDTRLQANALINALYAVIWSFAGYSNANYALSEAKEPVRTLKRAAPLAVFSVTLVYMLVNIAYFAVVPKEEILDSNHIVAALFFRNLFGAATEKTLSIAIALSTLGNILSGMFSQARLVQELGREGILPHSVFFASSKPFGAPLAGITWQYTISCLVVLAPPPGDAYTFTLNLASYPLALINALIAAGLLFLHTRTSASFGYTWKAPFCAWTPAISFFFLSNVFLAVVPFVPPEKGKAEYEHLPYFLHAVVALVIIALGGVYWYVWCVLRPAHGGYVLERKVVVQEDGFSRNVFLREPRLSE